MSEQPIHPIVMPKGTIIWVGPVNAGPPDFIEGEPYTMDEEGVTKWQKLGGSNGR